VGGKKEGKEEECQEQCKVCKEAEGKDDRMIQCDVCEDWNHVSCAGLDEKEFEVLKKGGRKVKWLCSQCDIPNVIEMIKTIKDIRAKYEYFEKGINEIKVEVANVAKRLNYEVDNLNKKLSENKAKLDKYIECVKNDIEKLVQKKD